MSGDAPAEKILYRVMTVGDQQVPSIKGSQDFLTGVH